MEHHCGLNLCLIILAILMCFFFSNGAVCFPSGIPPENRGTRLINGRNLTIGISDSYWTSMELAGRLQALLIREWLGFHVDVNWQISETTIQLLAVSGCQDALNWSCNDFKPDDPLVHFTPEFWERDAFDARSLMQNVTDPNKFYYAVGANTMGYPGFDGLHIWRDVVDKALREQNLSLNWYLHLTDASAMSYFTPIRSMNFSFGMYQTCNHDASPVLKNWGYLCNQSFENNNPWRQSAHGTWNATGAQPTQLRPLMNCSQVEHYTPAVWLQYIQKGFLCRGSGWWLTPPCVLKSPVDEFLDRCIPILAFNPARVVVDIDSVALLPAAITCISQWDGIEDYIKDWVHGQFRRGGPPNIALFEWWSPDRSIALNYGLNSPVSAQYERVSFATNITFLSSQILATLVSQTIIPHAPDVMNFLRKFHLRPQDMSELMDMVVHKAANISDLHKAKDAAVCEWARQTGPIIVWNRMLGEDSCWSNSFYHLTIRRCTPCPVGRTSLRSAKGYSGYDACQACPGGNAFELGTGCMPCQKGHFHDGVGDLTTCKVCQLGRFSNDSGRSSCHECHRGLTTKLAGSTHRHECVCSPGSYYEYRQKRCVTCTVGAGCPGGYSPALASETETSGTDPTVSVQERYMADFGVDQIMVYMCAWDSNCKGSRKVFLNGTLDAKGMCLGGSQKIACAECSSGRFRRPSGTCINCGGGIATLVLGVTTFLSIFLVCCYLFYKSMFPPHPLFLALGSLVTYVQAMLLVTSLDMDYPPRIHEARRVLAIFEFDVNAVGAPVSCLVGQSFMATYISQLATPALSFFGFCIVFLLTTAIRAFVCKISGRTLESPEELIPTEGRIRRLYDYVASRVAEVPNNIPLDSRLRWFWPAHPHDIINVTHKTFLSLYISLTNASMLISRSVHHPCRHRTVRTSAVVRHSNEWYTMVPVAIVAVLIYTVLPYCAVLYLTMVAPKSVSADPGFRRKYRSLWARFHPTAWWHGFVQINYGLLFNMTLFIFDNVRLQMTSAVALNVVYALSTAMLRPWKFVLNMKIDVVSKLMVALATLWSSNLYQGKPINSNLAVMLIAITFVVPLIWIILSMGNYAWRSGVTVVAAQDRKADFGQRLHDIGKIVGARSVLQIRAYAMNLLDKDVYMLDRALETIMFTMLGLQPKSHLRKRCAPIPYEVCVDGRLEGELKVLGLNSDDDARDLVRRLVEVLNDQSDYPKKESTRLFQNGDSSMCVGSRFRRASIREAVRGAQALKNKLTGMDDHIKSLFGHLAGDDLAQNLREEEFVEALSSYLDKYTVGHEFTKQQISIIFRYCDVNQDGTLSLIEFADAMINLPPTVMPQDDWSPPSGWVIPVAAHAGTKVCDATEAAVVDALRKVDVPSHSMDDVIVAAAEAAAASARSIILAAAAKSAAEFQDPMVEGCSNEEIVTAAVHSFTSPSNSCWKAEKVNKSVAKAVVTEMQSQFSLRQISSMESADARIDEASRNADVQKTDPKCAHFQNVMH